MSSLECDVEGARRVGAGAVWLNRGGGPGESSITPDYEVSSLHELQAILRACVTDA